VRLRAGRFDFSTAPTGRLVVPVEGLRSGKVLQDFEMMRRIESRKYPVITAELRRVTPKKEPDRYKLDADLTFHGVTRRIVVDALARPDDGRAILESEFVIDVR